MLSTAITRVTATEATDRIRAALDVALPQVLDAVDRFPLEEEAAYAGLLGQTYHYIVHTTPLIALAASRCRGRHAVHHRQLCHYLAEEADHDLLCLADLRALGRTVDEFPEHPLTAALYQVDYYWIEHVSPLAVFGRALLLESLAAARGVEIASRVTAAFGPEAASCALVHGEADPGHVEEALAALCDVAPEDAEVIAAVLRQSAVLYLGMLDAVRVAATH